MAYINTFRKDIEDEIVSLRIQENAIRRAFLWDHQMLYIQLGGPIKAENKRKEFEEKRKTLEDIYLKVFDERFEYRVFNEIL